MSQPVFGDRRDQRMGNVVLSGDLTKNSRTVLSVKGSHNDELSGTDTLPQVFYGLGKNNKFTAGKVDKKNYANGQHFGGNVLGTAKYLADNYYFEGQDRNQKLVKNPREGIEYKITSPLPHDGRAGVTERPVFIEQKVTDNREENANVVRDYYFLSKNDIKISVVKDAGNQVISAKIHHGANGSGDTELNKLLGDTMPTNWQNSH